jgi:hypothetical protein
VLGAVPTLRVMLWACHPTYLLKLRSYM